MGLKATVQNGRLIVDEETDLPEGTVLNLVVDDEGDDLDDEERHALDTTISLSLREAEAGMTIRAEDALSRLRSRRNR